MIAVALFEHWLHALAWGRCFTLPHRPGPGRLLGAYLAGGAINLLTPTATLGGELVRGALAPRGVPATERVASVTADRLAMSLADTLIGLAGFGVLVVAAPLSPLARAAVAVGALLFGSGVAIFFELQRRGRLASFFGERRLVRALLGRHLADRIAAGSREVDGRLAAFHRERAGDLRAAFGLHLAGTSVGALQLALFFAWLGDAVSPRAILTVFSVSIALDLFSFFVPARLGAQEGARMLAMSLAGLDPARGLLFSLVLRAEQLLWAGVGLVAYAAIAARDRTARVAPAAREVEHDGRPAREVAGGGGPC